MSKTITAVFGNGIFTTTAKVFQWDAGDKLQFVGIDLPENYKVEFANSLTGVAKPVLGDSTGVVIPSEYFQPGRMIYAWVVIPDNDGRYTKYQVNIPIYQRAEPTDEEPTPEQQSALDEAIAALNEAAESIPEEINSALAEAKASGEFDGNSIWYTLSTILDDGSRYLTTRRDLEGREGTPAAGDLVIGSEPGEKDNPTYLYRITGDYGPYSVLEGIGSLKGDTGPQGPAGQDGQDGAQGPAGADGEDGNRIWWTNHSIAQSDNIIFINRDYLNGPVEPTKDSVKVGDLIVGPEADSYDLTITTLYVISSFVTKMCILTRLCSIKGDTGATGPAGADGQDGATGPAGADGNSIWFTTYAIGIYQDNYQTPRRYLQGRDGTPAIGDLVIGNEPGESGSPTYLYCIVGENGPNAVMDGIGSLKGDPGEDGYSPEVTITQISGGHRVTITDEDHPQGQSFDVMDGQAAPVTSVNGQTGDVVLNIPSTAADVGAVAVAQGVAHAGEFLVVGSDGNITTVSVPSAQGVSF